MVTLSPRLAAWLFAPLLSFTLLAGSTGCVAQSVDTNPSTGTGGDDTNDTGTIAADEVELTYGSDSVKVNVTALDTVDYKGTKVVPLTSIWSTGKLKDDVSTLEFDFEGSDGFHPSMKGKCSANMAGVELDKGSMVPETRNLVWEDSLGLPGCYHVHDVVKIIALDVTP